MGEKIAEFDDIYKPRQIEISGDDLYVVDGDTIKLFSIKELKFIKQIGKKGEGPGEFKFWPRISVFPDIIFAIDRSPLNKKIVFFSRKGEFISERRLPRFTTVKKVKQNYLSRELSFSYDRKTTLTKVEILDNDLNLIKELYTEKKERSSINFGRGGKKKIDFEMFPRMKHAVTDGDFIYIIDTHKGFYFEIYDHKGNKLSTIEKKLEKIRFEGEFKKKILESLKVVDSKYGTENQYNYIFPEFLPEIADVEGKNNKIYVSTLRVVNDKSEIIIMDHKGNILKRAYVTRANPSCIHNDKFYYFIDNEEEEVWELHVEDL